MLHIMLMIFILTVPKFEQLSAADIRQCLMSVCTVWFWFYFFIFYFFIFKIFNAISLPCVYHVYEHIIIIIIIIIIMKLQELCKSCRTFCYFYNFILPQSGKILDRFLCKILFYFIFYFIPNGQTALRKRFAGLVSELFQFHLLIVAAKFTLQKPLTS